MLSVIEEIFKSLPTPIASIRMDGDVSVEKRADLIYQFNKTTDRKDIAVFLLTTRVGGLGINLTAANKVVVFDPDWNPMVDL